MTRSAVAYWVGKYNTEVGLFVAQQAATLVEHNARYVNGLGTGALWSAQDASDLAAYTASQAALAAETTLYNNEVAAYNAMLADRNAQAAALAAETTLYNAAEAARVAAVALAATNLVPNAIFGTLTIPITAGSPPAPGTSTFQAPTYDPSGMFSSGTSIICRRSGTYVLVVGWQSSGGGTGWVRYYVNGGVVVDTGTTFNLAGNTTHAYNASAIALNVNDSVSYHCSQDGGGANTGSYAIFRVA